MNQKYLVKNLSDLIEYETKRNIKKHIPYVGLEDIQSNSGTFLGSKDLKKLRVQRILFHLIIFYMVD
jgi:hypothetical protein